MRDDFDAPNTLPGICPECGQDADIWCAVAGHYECRLCSWTGRNPLPKPQPDALPP